jgi:hypothetical protein
LAAGEDEYQLRAQASTAREDAAVTGTHREAVAMRYVDFDALTSPVVGSFAGR